jgi:hypothetical protein
MPYEYELIFQLFTEDYIDLETTYSELLANCEYKPKLNFQGQKECYDLSHYEEISSILKQRHSIALAPLKRTEAIREDKKREEKIIENKNILMSEAIASNEIHGNETYFKITKAFYMHFCNQSESLRGKGRISKALTSAKFDSWYEVSRKLIEVDKNTLGELRDVHDFLTYKDEDKQKDFWNDTVSSLSGIRKNFDKLLKDAKKLKPSIPKKQVYKGPLSNINRNQ